MRKPSLGKEIKCAELADMLDAQGSKETKVQYARRWLKDRGIARRFDGKQRYFTTLADLLAAGADHVWRQAVARGYSDE